MLYSYLIVCFIFFVAIWVEGKGRSPAIPRLIILAFFTIAWMGVIKHANASARLKYDQGVEDGLREARLPLTPYGLETGHRYEVIMEHDLDSPYGYGIIIDPDGNLLKFKYSELGDLQVGVYLATDRRELVRIESGN